MIDDALRVVGVAVGTEAAGVGGVKGVLDVDHGQTAAAGAAADAVGEAGVFVDDDVVGVAPAGVVGVFGEGDGRVGDVAQAREVEDLHAVAAGFADDEGVVVVNLDVAPGGVAGVWGQVAHVDGVFRIADVHEGRAAGAAHDGVLDAGLGIGPAPNVVATAAADVGQGHEGEQVHVVAGVSAGKTAHTRRRRHRV